jgi:hypothetical protein
LQKGFHAFVGLSVVCFDTLAFVQNEQQGEELDSSFEMILSTEDEFSTIEFPNIFFYLDVNKL